VCAGVLGRRPVIVRKSDPCARGCWEREASVGSVCAGVLGADFGGLLMFDLKVQKGTSLPSKAALDRLKFDAVIAQNPITEANCKCMFMPLEYVQKLAHAWDTLREPVPIDLNDFGVRVESHPSRHGFVIMTARYYKGAVHPGVELIWDVDDGAEEEVLKFEEGDGEIENHPESFWKEVWSPFLAVTQIVIDVPKIQPNSRCGCGSGKKYKKCCGRQGVKNAKDI
jgi:hypothetical protein